METETPSARARRFQLIMGASLATLLLAYWLKVQCLAHPPGGGYEFRHYCYSDTYFHYGQYGFAAGATPYVTHWNEYPALTGIFSWVIAQFATDVVSWWQYHAWSLLAFGLAATYGLFRMGHDWRSAAPWVLGPTVVMSGLTNYDLWPIGFLGLGLWCYHERRLPLAGLFLGLGAAAKLFPGFLWPVLVVVLLNEARNKGLGWQDRALYKRPLRLTAGFLLGLLPVNLVLIAANRDLWMQTWRFQSERGTTYETIYYLVDQEILQPVFQHAMSVDEMNAVGALGFFGGSLWLLIWALRKRVVDAYTLSVAIVALYLLTTKVYSTQHTLWLLVPMVVARIPKWTWAILTAADLVALVWLYQMFTPPVGAFEGRDYAFEPNVRVASAARLIAIGIILAVAVWRLRRATMAPPAATVVAPGSSDQARMPA